MDRCKWTKTEDLGFGIAWASECKGADGLIFNLGSPSKNGFKFCAYCGKPIIEVSN